MGLKLIHNFDFSAVAKIPDEQIIKGILKDFKITQIARVGYIRKYLFSENDFSKTFLKKTLGEYFPNINDISLRFSKKIPRQDSLMKKDVDDYINVIYQVIKKSDRDELFMSVDYQLIYQPYLQKSSYIEFDKFVESLQSYNSDEYLKWVNEYYAGAISK